MRTKLQISSFVIFTILLLASAAKNLIAGSALIGWPEIVLIIMVLFVAMGERFAKVVISPKQISIEQMVGNLEQDIKKIDQFVQEETPADEISKIIEDTLEHPRDIWSKLLLIRMTLRRLLRKIADANAMGYSPTASISRMIRDFRNKGLIDDTLANQIERIRDATFTVEWGTGEPPKPEDVKFTLEGYGKVFEALKQRARPQVRA